jgi:hypothetical protein
VTLCVVCTMHVEMRSEGFLIGPQNQGRRFVSALTLKHWDSFLQLTSKLVVTVSPGFALKSVARVSHFGHQNRQLRFGNLGLKITALISWFGPQNHIDYSLLVTPQNRWEGDDVGHASRSSGLLHFSYFISYFLN